MGKERRTMNLFCFGLGYSARVFAEQVRARGWAVSGTSRSPDGVAKLAAAGFKALRFDGENPSAEVAEALRSAQFVLVSAAPDGFGDPVLRCHAADLAAAPALRWLGYLSTVGVYGDHQGGWVDETSELRPLSERSLRRVEAEQAWRDWHGTRGCALGIFRLSGIYGPGRNALENVLDGEARRIVKPGQVFNRIHVDDIAGALLASTERMAGLSVLNVTDDEPAPPQDVVAYAAQLLDRPPPPEIAFEDAALSAMARSFYSENKRVSNRRLSHELGYRLAYPTYREGLAGLLPGVLRRYDEKA
jgi:nucleoside-diphosphate-sugar epimerase